MPNNGLNYVDRLFDTNGEIKDWESNKSEFNLENKILFSWMQLIDFIPVSWKRNIMDDKGRGHPFMTSTRSGKGAGRS